MSTRDLNLDGEIFSLPSTLVDAIEEAGRQRHREGVVLGGQYELAGQQQGYADQAIARADMVYSGRLSMRAFMARALAKRVARGEDLRAKPAGVVNIRAGNMSEPETGESGT